MFSEDISIKKRFRPVEALKKNYSHFIEILHAKGHFDCLNGGYPFLAKFFIKLHRFPKPMHSTYLPKPEFQRFFPTPERIIFI